MYLKVKIKCVCGCSYSIDNSLGRVAAMKCPNCARHIDQTTIENFNEILVAARQIEVPNSCISGVVVKSKP